MNKKERVQAALLSKNLDRPPISLWMNYPEVDQEPLSLAKAHIAFQEKFDLDFIKLTPFDLYTSPNTITPDKKYKPEARLPVYSLSAPITNGPM